MALHGYKVFMSDWSCRGYRYEKQYHCPGIFKEDGELAICEHGMHFCTKLIDCFNYYRFDRENHVAEVVARGDILGGEDGKYCTNELEIVREIPWDEVLEAVNIGEKCEGIGNVGPSNSGSYNCGSGNTGNFNCGCNNWGNTNSGNFNRGCRNSGNFNIGDFNTGNFNIGNYNTGDFNLSNNNTGCFSTGRYKRNTITLFNKPSDWTLIDWELSYACHVLSKIPSPAERQNWWDCLDYPERAAVLELPNFDADVFEECTGINVRKHKEDEE